MERRQRTAHAATQVFGLGLVSITLLAVVALVFILFDGEEVASIAVAALIALVVTLLAWRFDSRWTKVVGILGTVLATLPTFFLAFGVLQPFSPIEFILGLLFVVGVVVALIGGVRAVGAQRRSVPAGAGEARMRRMVTAALGVAVAVSIGGYLVTRTAVAADDAAGAANVDMAEFAFSPTEVSVPAGGRLLVTNTDPFVHDLTVAALDVAVTLGPGSEAIVDLGRADPGTYEFVCTLHSSGGEGMVGTITIEP